MSGAKSRRKGIVGELEVINILKSELGDSLNIGRALSQTRDGGCDIAGNLPFSIEVKNCAILAIPQWWRQTCEQARIGKPPVLVYKIARKGWRVMLPLDLVSGWELNSEHVCEMDIFAFCDFAREVISSAVLMEMEGQDIRLDS